MNASQRIDHLLAGPSRRRFLASAGAGLSSIPLTSLLADEQGLSANPHFPPKIKSVIWLFMAGGARHLATADPKPAVNKNGGGGNTPRTGAQPP